MSDNQFPPEEIPCHRFGFQKSNGSGGAATCRPASRFPNKLKQNPVIGVSPITRRPSVFRWTAGVLSFVFLQLAFASTVFARPGTADLPTPNRAVTKPAAGVQGRLETISITLERPDDSIVVGQLNFPPPEWHFPDQSASNVIAYLRKTGASPAEVAVLSATNHLVVEGHDVVIRPPAELILGLKPDVRRIIYTALGTQLENPYHRQPFFVTASSPSEWLEHSGLSPATEQLMRGLMYQRGRLVHFADPQVITGLDDGEKFRVMKTLSRIPTLVGKLHVDRSSDPAAIAAYWGPRGRDRRLKPLIESLARLNGGAVIDVSELLPPFARTRLYTYPEARRSAGEVQEDCFWTAMNFFSESPDARFHSFDQSLATLRADYLPVERPYRFGDVVTFLNPRGQPIHACVHLAADLVFTKNGATPNQPWILMKLEDVSATYLATELPRERLGMVVFRRKGS